MAPDRGSRRAKAFKDLQQPESTEVDPEVDDIPDDSSAEDESEDGMYAAREHYIDVGKSKLRKPKEVALGPQYRGTRVRRNYEKDEDDEDDPFTRDLEGDDSDSESVQTKREREGAISDGSSPADETEDTDLDEEDEVSNAQPRGIISAADRQELKNALRQDERGIITSLSASLKGEAEKGRAVKQQRKTFESLLNARIKLQKSLISTNTITGLSRDELISSMPDASQAIEAAEIAAFRLWSSLTAHRNGIVTARTGDKRKLECSTETSTKQLWLQMQEQEEANLPHRHATLQKWSAKTKDPMVRTQGSLMSKTDRQTSIIDVLQQQLVTPDHLLRRAHTPRSCAPLQLARKLITDPKIYDDADFYGLLLKELLEQKSDSALTATVNVDFDLRREAKTKKQVDTKASKGRKLRYTVHEKLQNFMAPEDRRTWGDHATDELFGSLFGRRMGLSEDVEMDADIEDDLLGEDRGLLLFRG